ncbi:MAG: NAD(P)/FAD-dependent oxidoreductase [Candidatus Thorarchaeota archaeon]
MNTDTDVIVIGAGPAGLSAAKILAELDVDYLLFDRELNPGENKPCAGFIPISSIRRFSIPKISDQHEINEVRMKFPGKELVTIEFDRLLGVNVSRGALSKTLQSMIPQTRSIFFGTKVSKVETNSDSCKITLREDGNLRTLTSKLIIDASGANPVSQRFTPIRPRIPNSRMGYGLQYHIEVDDVLDNSNVFLYGNEYSPSGYSWIFPRGKVAVLGTGGLVRNIRENKRRTHEYLDYILKEVEPFRSELSDGVIIKKDSALMPLCGVMNPSYGKRILLAGDAAGHCSPISGEGIHYSMVGGFVAAQVAARSIRKKKFSDRALSTYEKKWTWQIGADLKWGFWLQRKLMRPGNGRKSAGWGGSGFIDSQKSQRIIAEMLMCEKSVIRSMLAIAPGYLKSKISKK